jgi:hypothetical protein
MFWAKKLGFGQSEILLSLGVRQNRTTTDFCDAKKYFSQTAKLSNDECLMRNDK